jgi:arylsulfatase A-like enzyme
VYGSLCSWPPRKVKGFYVPDTFAPDLTTHPTNLQAIQKLNLTYTRSVRLPTDEDGLLFKVKLGVKLLKLGLSANTIQRIARQLGHERRNPEVRWRRVALQPMVNFDFFSRLYRNHHPEFATFHTNHVAHYMHTYWKAMQPDVFPQETTEEERRSYAGAIEHGYRTADELLERMMGLLDADTVMVVASSMGQQPFITPLKKGKRIGQLRSLDRLVDILGAEGRVRALPTMSDQFNLYPDSSTTKNALLGKLQGAYIDAPARRMFYVDTVEDSITVTLRHYDETTEDSLCVFPHREKNNSYRFEDLVYGTGMVKSGCHDPKGMMMLYGPGITQGGHISNCTNLDIAPTLLTLLGLPVPDEMRGRVLSEAFTA